MAAKVVSIINLKGGVGKSTIAMILGEYMAYRHAKRVLLIDMDSQCNLTYAMVKDTNFSALRASGRTIDNLFKAALTGQIRPMGDIVCDHPLWVSNIARGIVQPTLDIVVSSPDLAQLDIEMLTMWEARKPAPSGFEYILHNSMATTLNNYNVVLIDCPPGLSLFTSCAILASDYFIAPVVPEPLSIMGLDLVTNRITGLKGKYSGLNIEFKGSILNKVRSDRKTHKRIAEQLYGSHANKYSPFEWWVPDAERLRVVGDFECEETLNRKFEYIRDKYDVGYTLTNPVAVPSLDRSNSNMERRKYHFWERLDRLTQEFIDTIGV